MEYKGMENYIRTMKSAYWKGVERHIQRYMQSLWHKPEEVPESGRWLLVEYMDDKLCYDTLQRTQDNWTEAYNYDGNITKWCYVDDLLPKEGEEE